MKALILKLARSDVFKALFSVTGAGGAIVLLFAGLFNYYLLFFAVPLGLASVSILAMLLNSDSNHRTICRRGKVPNVSPALSRYEKIRRARFNITYKW